MHLHDRAGTLASNIISLTRLKIMQAFHLLLGFAENQIILN